MKKEKLRKRFWASVAGLFFVGSGVMLFFVLVQEAVGPQYNAQLSDIQWSGDEWLIYYENHSYDSQPRQQSQILRPDGEILAEGENFLMKYMDESRPVIVKYQDRPYRVLSLDELTRDGLRNIPVPDGFGKAHIEHVSFSPDTRYLLLQGSAKRKIYVQNQETEEWVSLQSLFTDEDVEAYDMWDVEWRADDEHTLVIVFKNFNEDGSYGPEVARRAYNPERHTLEEVAVSNAQPLQAHNSSYPGPVHNSMTVVLHQAREYQGGVRYAAQSANPQDIEIEVTQPAIGKQKVIVHNRKTAESHEVISWFSTWKYNEPQVRFLGDSRKILLINKGEVGVLDTTTGQFAHLMNVEPDTYSASTYTLATIPYGQ